MTTLRQKLVGMIACGNPDLRHFFEIEIRNGYSVAREHGFDDICEYYEDGETYDFRQTLDTAVNSLGQAPDDVLDDWEVSRNVLIDLCSILTLVDTDTELIDILDWSENIGT